MSSSFSGKVRIPLRRNTPAAASAGADWSGASPGGRGSPPEGSGVRGSALAAGLLLFLPSGSCCPCCSCCSCPPAPAAGVCNSEWSPKLTRFPVSSSNCLLGVIMSQIHIWGVTTQF